jgi:hypothetical protein
MLPIPIIFFLFYTFPELINNETNFLELLFFFGFCSVIFLFILFKSRISVFRFESSNENFSFETVKGIRKLYINEIKNIFILKTMGNKDIWLRIRYKRENIYFEMCLSDSNWNQREKDFIEGIVEILEKNKKKIKVKSTVLFKIG